MKEWWTEYFFSRVYKAKAAFHRGIWIGVALGFLLDSFLSKVLS